MAATSANPVLAEWTGPHGGAPVFAAVTPSDFPPALDEAMALHRAEVRAIADNPAPATFANTLEALERAGQAFDRAATMLGIYTSTLNDAAMQGVQREVMPKLAAFGDEIVHDPVLFARIQAVYETRETSGLTPEQQRLAFVVHDNFARQGAALAPASKQRLG